MMFKLSAIFVLCAVIAMNLVEANPNLLAAPGVVTATSSQYVARNFNGFASAPVLAPVAAAAYSAPISAAYNSYTYAAYPDVSTTVLQGI